MLVRYARVWGGEEPGIRPQPTKPFNLHNPSNMCVCVLACLCVSVFVGSDVLGGESERERLSQH